MVDQLTQTKPHSTKPNQTTPHQTKLNQTKPNQLILLPLFLLTVCTVCLDKQWVHVSMGWISPSRSRVEGATSPLFSPGLKWHPQPQPQPQPQHSQSPATGRPRPGMEATRVAAVAHTTPRPSLPQSHSAAQSSPSQVSGLFCLSARGELPATSSALI